MNERLKELREVLSFTQQKFADRLSISRNYVAQIEMGTKTPSDRTINDICREFSVNEEWLRNGTGDMFRQIDEDFGAVCAEIGVNDPQARDAIMKYMQLTEEDRALFWKFLKTIVD